MKCEYCGEEIYEKDEDFYIVSNSNAVTCNKCCDSSYSTFYVVCGEIYDEDEVVRFKVKEKSIASYERDISVFKYRIAEMEKLNLPWKDAYIKQYKSRIEETQDLLKALKDED